MQRVWRGGGWVQRGEVWRVGWQSVWRGVAESLRTSNVHHFKSLVTYVYHCSSLVTSGCS